VNELVRPKPGIGILVFILVIVMMIFVAAPIQFALGMWGLAITELLLLAAAVIPALIFRWNLREIFRFQIPSFRQVFGTLVLWVGGYIAVMTVTMIISYFFPEGMTNVSSQMLELFRSVPFPVTLFIVAVMPAVCEEALHRGLIQFTFRGASKWVTVLSMGFIFGVFHLDPYRFLGTAILGALLTLIMVETKNILLPILFHLVNNSLSALASQVSTPSAEAVAIPLASVGVLIMLATVVPFLFMGGSRLLLTKQERQDRPIKKKAIITAVALTVVLAVTGVAITASSAVSLINQLMGDPIFETSFSGGVNKDSQGHLLDFNVEKDGKYHMTLEIEGEEGVLTTMIITDAAGEEVYNATCGSMTSEGPLELKAGDYQISIAHSYDGLEYLTVSVDIIIK